MTLFGEKLLPPLSTWLLLAVFTVTYYVAVTFYVRFRYLRFIPGPKWAGYSRLWLLRTLASGDSAWRFLEVNKKYGPLARIGPNHLLSTSPSVGWKVLAARSPYVRGPWFDSLRFDPHFSSIASERDPKKHDSLRYKVSAGYATKEFIHLERTVDACFSKWIHSIDQGWISRPGNIRQYDIARSIRTLTMEISGHVCFSEGLEFTEDQAQLDKFWASIEENAPYGQYLSVIPELFRSIYALTKIPVMKERMILTETNNPGIGKIIGIARRVTEQRYGPNSNPQDDMLGSWIKHGLSPTESATEISIAIVTGAFPVAAAINFLLLHITTKPKILAKLRRELDGAIAAGLVSTPIQNSETKTLAYLQACIDEGLRVSPPITQLRERVTPPQGDVIDGHFVPGGVFIGFNVPGTQLHECFGPNPECFDPERWLIEDSKRLEDMKRIQGLIFGYGSTKCLGMTQASMVLNKTLVELLRRYDITVMNPARPWIDQSNGVSFHRNFNVSVERREDV